LTITGEANRKAADSVADLEPAHVMRLPEIDAGRSRSPPDISSGNTEKRIAERGTYSAAR